MGKTGSLAGKVAVVTGSSRGIGKQTSLELAALGASVVITDRVDEARASTPGSLKETAEAIRAMGGSPLAVPADLSDQDEIDGLIATTLKELGGVDILINNAAYTVGRALWTHAPNLSRQQWEKCVAVNVTAPLMLIQGLWESMRSRGGGVVVNMTSGAADLQPLDMTTRLEGADLENGPVYGATKAALNRMCNVLAHEASGCNIAVIQLNPGGVLTETISLTLTQAGMGSAAAEMRQPTVPAKTIAYLCCSGEAMSYSGQIVDSRVLYDRLGLGDNDPDQKTPKG